MFSFPRRESIQKLYIAEKAGFVLTAAIGVAIWAVFRPGLMSYDSIVQYGQAMAGSYTDWHPPLMSIVLHVVLAAGRGIGALMFVQCLAGVFGVRAFAAAALRRLHGDRISPARVSWLSLLVLLVLLLPGAPLAFYLMTFWKDSWAMILLLWIGALALRPLDRPGVALLLALAAVYGQIRHNAIVTLPFLGIFLWTEARRRGFRAAPLLALAPLAASLALGVFLNEAFDVKETHPAGQVMAFDLVGLCAEEEAVCRDLPLVQKHLRSRDYRTRYRPGDLGSVFWEEPVILDPGIMGEPLREELVEEHREAALEHPLLMAEVKAEAFLGVLDTDRTYYFIHNGLQENPYGMKLNERFQEVRDRMAAVANRTVEPGNPLRWIVGVHLVWLLANVLWIAGLLRSRRSLALFLFVPLTYYLSYLLAATVPDFRFMLPATLMIQGLTLAGAAGLLAQKPAGRAPYRASISE
jgi:hypothetical protein